MCVKRWKIGSRDPMKSFYWNGNMAARWKRACCFKGKKDGCLESDVMRPEESLEGNEIVREVDMSEDWVGGHGDKSGRTMSGSITKTYSMEISLFLNF